MSENVIRPAAEYVEYDKNMVVSTAFDAPDARFFDIRQEPFDIYGFYDTKDPDGFIRLPRDVANNTSKGVANLAWETSGGRVRFCTDSGYVIIRAEMSKIAYSTHIPLAGTGGFDLYVDSAEKNGKSRLHKPFLPPYGMKEGYEQILRFDTRSLRYLTINFPVHARVKNLYIGLQEDAVLGGGKKYRNAKPVVFYGSSITHGSAASRPGLTYPNILSRMLDINIYNLGFSGNAKGEPATAEYIAGLDMAAFVFDYDHNAPTPEHLKNTHAPFFETVRKKHPLLPVIMVTRPTTYPGSVLTVPNKRIIRENYENAVANGDRNVYFIDGESFYAGAGEDDCSMDGTHPNDLGFYRMAERMAPVISGIMENNGDFEY